DGYQGYRYQLLENHQVLSYAQVIKYWQTDPSFIEFFNNVLAESPYEGIFWESIAVTRNRLNSSYEMVVMDSPSLARVVANSAPFEARFSDSSSVVVFTNLGGDATLVVPCPVASGPAYPHLAAFVRNAPSTQLHEFWQQVGTAMEAAIGEQPRWLSTAGLGVYWVHVRIDSRPKYYRYKPFRASMS
ncbi:MAG: hypothetical protein AAGB22_10555, partial [Bacteroidota bacterium]